LRLLDPVPQETVLDLGCGTGELLSIIRSAGTRVIGLDNDPGMLAKAVARCPDVEFIHADAHTFRLRENVDAVFSNSVLHWMTRPDEVIARVAAALRPGGRFVAEANAARAFDVVLTALDQARSDVGITRAMAQPWYLPTPAAYATLLENAGFEVRSMAYFARPTALSTDLADWIRMFCAEMIADLDRQEANAVIALTERTCRPALYRDGVWHVDYYRLRFRAELPTETSRITAVRDVTE
jgi:trans-aconitate methyltransferase